MTEIPAAETPPPREKFLSKSKVIKVGTIFKKQAQHFFAWIMTSMKKVSLLSYSKLIATVLSSYFLASIAILFILHSLPQPTSEIKKSIHDSRKLLLPTITYDKIFLRNLFNHEGIIPGDEVAKLRASEGVPVRSSLPFQLIGTLILENEARSIATLRDSDSRIYPMSKNDELPNILKIRKVETSKVLFANLQNNQFEFIEMQNDNPRLQTLGLKSAGLGKGIEKINATQYSISRAEVDRALADFNQILTQARAVPNFENGTANGYKLFQIVPGSIYDKLGLQNGDNIVGLNGTPINDPGKAFEMLSELKTANHLELQIKKDGKLQTYTYDIH